MNIVQVNQHDLRGGGALIAYQLHLGYLKRGLPVRFLVSQPSAETAGVEAIPTPEDLYPAVAWFRKYSRKLKKSGLNVLGRAFNVLAEPHRYLANLMGREEFNYPGFEVWLSSANPQPELLHLHNLHDRYFDLRALPRLSQRFPVLITLHDTWLLSGHCAHFLDCQRWQTGCGNCPYLDVYPALRRDGSAANWRARRAIYAQSRLYLAAPSQWVIDQTRQSILWPAVRISRVIRNGIDLGIFRPADKTAARAALGLPQDALVVLFTANRVKANQFKDYPTLRRAVSLAAEGLPDQRLIFLALGEDAPTEFAGKAELRFLPHRTGAASVAGIYQAADLYIHAARADTYPTTILEAQACGLPVVATAVGGIPEQVIEGVNGFLTPPADPAAMADRIQTLARDEQMRDHFSQEALAFARKHHDQQRMIAEYLAYYREILGDYHQA